MNNTIITLTISILISAGLIASREICNIIKQNKKVNKYILLTKECNYLRWTIYDVLSHLAENEKITCLKKLTDNTILLNDTIYIPNLNEVYGIEYSIDEYYNIIANATLYDQIIKYCNDDHIFAIYIYH